MTWIDWTIMAGFVAVLAGVAFYARIFNKGVADFLVANRCAGRYLLTMSEGMAGLGAITVVGFFEMFYSAGFTANWWAMLQWPIWLFVALSGWIVYRYRETRVMTMAQFFERRYSRKLRVFCGIVAWLAGMLNMGIFPAVTARFFMYFCGLPEYFPLFGVEFSTFAVLMFIELAIALLFTLVGGMIAVIITDFIQGLFCNIVFLVLIVVLFLKFDWSQVISTLSVAPEGASMIHPFKTTKTEDFNLFFFLISAFIGFYAYKTWQGNQSYSAAAKNAHEAKMATILAMWRGMVQTLIIMILPIGAYVFLHHVDFSAQAQVVQQKLGLITDETIRIQMRTPIVLANMLPVGVLGLFAALMFAATLSTDDTYLHAWGSIFIQDVILPFRKKGFAPKQHMWLLRFSIIFVAIFIFLFSFFFRQNDRILMYIQLTGAIYTGGAGSIIIGGLYWKRGSTKGAWAAIITGVSLALTGGLCRLAWPDIAPVLQNWFPQSEFLAQNAEKFPYNGIQIALFTDVCAILSYIAFSLFDWMVCRKPAHNMDRLLHRGKYTIKGEHGEDVKFPVTGLRALLPDKEFVGKDRIIHYSVTFWTVGWVILFIVVTAYNLIFGVSDQWWSKYWLVNLCIFAIVTLITTVWFAIGGALDIRYLFKTLKTVKRDELDDGRVTEADKTDDKS